MIAPACSAAFPTIGSRIMLMNLSGIPNDSDASWKQNCHTNRDEMNLRALMYVPKKSCTSIVVMM